jgi:hypothetical protein
VSRIVLCCTLAARAHDRRRMRSTRSSCHRCHGVRLGSGLPNFRAVRDWPPAAVTYGSPAPETRSGASAAAERASRSRSAISTTGCATAGRPALRWPEADRTEVVCADPGITEGPQPRAALPEPIRPRVAESPAREKLSVRIGHRLADMHDTARELARAVAEPVPTSDRRAARSSNRPRLRGAHQDGVLLDAAAPSSSRMPAAT